MARGAPVRNPAAKNRAAPNSRVVVSVKRLFSQESPHYVVMVAIVLFLVIFGLVMVLSSSFVDSALGNDGNFFAVFLRQAMWVLMGIPVMFLLARVQPIAILRAAPAGLLAALFLQSLVFTPLGVTSGGNRNWIALGNFSAQPSELLKVTLILWMAAILSSRLEAIGELRTLVTPLGIGVVASIGMVMVGGDLGTVGVMVVVVIGVVFLAGERWPHFLPPRGFDESVPGFLDAQRMSTSPRAGKRFIPPLRWALEECLAWAWATPGQNGPGFPRQKPTSSSP